MTLRDLLGQPIIALHARGHREIPGICSRLGLPPPPAEGSRRQRMESSFAAAPERDLPLVASLYIEHFGPSPMVRNRIQEFLWVEQGPTVSKKVRREVARALAATDLYRDAAHFDLVLTSLWIVEDDPLDGFVGRRDDSLRAGINRHVYDNPGDWTPEDLFDRLGAFECSDRRFCLFIERLASADVRPDEGEQRRFVALVNGALREAKVELRETGVDGGYPVFTAVALGHHHPGRPKNLIFASSTKPDLRLRDAVSNDIEIVGEDAERVLVYDRPIGAEGVRWRDLQQWWQERAVPAASADPAMAQAAKTALYRRLRSSLPQNSPPQRFFFDTFHRTFAQAVHNLPALLPEVWLHWDPKLASERGGDALFRFRMDFLLLLPHDVRVVVEVDGKHHYADDAGRGCPTRYAAMMAADRELRLAGYELYRFGASELDGTAEAQARVEQFFRALFKRHAVRLP